MLEPTEGAWRTELMSRESSGITVRMLWSRAANLVTIAVEDAASDEYFELVLDEDESALEVFHHPFAHAAARRVPHPAAGVGRATRGGLSENGGIV
jgi:hypothetical protein